MEMDARRLVEVVREDRLDLVALDDVDARARPRAVEAERVDRLVLGVDLVLDLIDGQLEHLRAADDPWVAVGLVPGTLERGGLAIEEALDHGQSGRIVVVHAGTLGLAGARARGAVVHGSGRRGRSDRR